MTDYCTVADVEAVLGYPIPAEQVARVQTLIGMASDVVDGALSVYFEDTASVPRSVAYVTASLVVRTMANPGAALSSESLGAARFTYPGGGMALTDEDRATLGPWLAPEYDAYTVCTPLAGPCGGDTTVISPFDWERDLDPEGVD